MKKISNLYIWNKEEFPKIKFSSNKQGREENVSVINKNQYLKEANLLYDKGKFQDSFLINIMWCFASRPNQMLTLKFENFEDKDDQKYVYYANNKINERNYYIKWSLWASYEI